MEDTIAAISTPPGEGAIAVVRISGEKALPIVRSVFRGRISLKDMQANRIVHGWIVDGEEPVDEVLLSLFRKPGSYTGEDLVEISCHGGRYISRRILGCLIQRGARLAEPGEFTQRAFLNGKMDLSQAEAVADLIRARTEISRKVAVYQLEGHLANKLEALRNKLAEVLTLLELELDFAEEDVKFVPGEKIEKMIVHVSEEIEELLMTFDRGRVCREGTRMVIVGKPNAGKSSLLNALLARERAIVTHTPGTTRDTIEDVLDMGGVLFTVSDTAGIRKAGEPVEAEGVRRARKAMKVADMLLVVFDASIPFNEEDELVLESLKPMSCEKIAVINKIDLPAGMELSRIQDAFSGGRVFRVSAKTQKGVPQLIKALEEMALSGDIPKEGEVILTHERHRQCLIRAGKSLRECLSSHKRGMSGEFVAVDMRGAIDAIGEITGKTTADDILEQIFSRFCIGK
jgi:tRNA modification GTPase